MGFSSIFWFRRNHIYEQKIKVINKLFSNFFDNQNTLIISLHYVNIFGRIQYTADQLWIPSTSAFRENKEWKNKNFQKNTRYENVAFRSENILTPEGIMQVGWEISCGKQV